MGSRQDDSDVVLINGSTHNHRRKVKPNSDFKSLDRYSRPATKPQPFVFKPPPPRIEEPKDTDLFPNKRVHRKIGNSHSPQNTLGGNDNSTSLGSSPTSKRVGSNSSLTSATGRLVISDHKQQQQHTEQESNKRKFALLQNTVKEGGRGSSSRAVDLLRSHLVTKKIKDEKYEGNNSKGDDSKLLSRGMAINRREVELHNQRQKELRRESMFGGQNKAVVQDNSTASSNRTRVGSQINNILHSGIIASHSKPITPSYRIKVKACQLGPFIIDCHNVYVKIIDKPLSNSKYSPSGIRWELECSKENYISRYPDLALGFGSLSTIYENDIESVSAFKQKDEVELFLKVTTSSRKTIYKGKEIPIEHYYFCLTNVITGKVEEFIENLKVRKGNVLKCDENYMKMLKMRLKPVGYKNRERLVGEGFEGRRRLVPVPSRASVDSSSTMGTSPISTLTTPLKPLVGRLGESSKPSVLVLKDPRGERRDEDEKEEGEEGEEEREKEREKEKEQSLEDTISKYNSELSTQISNLSLKSTFLYKFPDNKSLDITQLDYKSLNDMVFVNDTIINLFLRVSLFESNYLQSTHLFNTFFYDKLSQKDEYGRPSFEGAMRWTAKVDLFSKKYVIMPINESMHWYVAIIYNLPAVLEVKDKDKDKEEQDEKDQIEDSRELRNRTIRTRSKSLNDEKSPIIFILDSLKASQARSNQTAKKIRDFLITELQQRKNIKISKDLIKSKSVAVPQQDNYCDCGLYVIHYIERFLSDPEKFVTFMTSAKDRKEVEEIWDQKSMKDKRLKLKLKALKLESISRGELLDDDILQLERQLDEANGDYSSKSITTTGNSTHIPSSPSNHNQPTINSSHPFESSTTLAPPRSTTTTPILSPRPSPHPSSDTDLVQKNENDENDDDIMVVSSSQIRNLGATRTSKRIASRYQ